MKDIYEKLEFYKIKDKLKQYVHCELALYYVQNLKMLSKDALEYALKELNEASMYASNYKGIVIYQIKNIMNDLSLLLKEGNANIEFFYTVSLMLENVYQIKKDYIKEERFAILNSHIDNLKNLESLKNRIDSIISNDLSIYDHASNQLYSLRNQIKKEEASQSKILSSLMNKYRAYLNDERMALRSQGLALPIKTSFKNKVDGVVIDMSSTGNTSFIMPIEILLSNNKISLLKEQEQQEIIRILKDLANYCTQFVDDIRRNLITLASLDFLFAKVAYGFEIKGVIAQKKDSIELVEARHPLIDMDKIVANSFIFENKKIMLITGPNAGGKTVALKTVALLVVMNQCALMVPSKEANLPYFSNIFLDIGDDQSLSENLSTFTSHINALKNAVSNVDEQSLVIIDELGHGTSPLEGEALAVGVLKFLHEKNSFAMVSSHYDGLKNFALENDYILPCSMIFDEDNLCPTYKIRLGSISKSYGIEVSLREGLKQEIIDYAKEYLSKIKNSQQEKTINVLNNKLLEVDNLKAILEEEKKSLEENLKKQEQELNKIKQEKAKLEDSFQEEKEKMLLDAKKDVENLLAQFKQKKDVKLHEVIALKKKLDDSINSEQEEIDENSEIFKINDRVIYKPNSLKGYVKEISKDKVIINLDTGLIIKVKSNTLTHVKENNNVKKVPNKPLFISKHDLNMSVSLECNVIGLHVQEALEVISKYLDDALKVKYKQVRIIHGNGTGKLRFAIHEYLKKQKFVSSFYLGTTYEGGTGSTVVNIK